ncbi:MAG: hypothetical protein GAK37_02002 [Pseudomonas sp.]|nr:MAG: hypothetical protein GAK37_02002 [Pseudomonas sp.]
MADVRGQVAQVARERHALGDGLRVGHGAFHFSLGGFDRQQGDFLKGAGLGLLALELVENVAAVHQGFGQQAGLAVAVATFDHDLVQCQGSVGAAQAFKGAQDGADDLAERTVAQFGVFAHADQQHALGLEVGQALQQQALADFAGQVAALEHGRDGAAAQFIQLPGGNAQLAAFADSDHEGGGFQRFGANAFYNQFHFRVPCIRSLNQASVPWSVSQAACRPPVTKPAV